MAFLNKWQGIGNLGRDLEIKTFTNSGDKLGKSSMAVTKRFTKSDTTKGEKTIWVNLDFPDHLVENASKFLTKGRSVFIEGELEIRDYTEEGGAKKQAVSVRVENYQLLDKPKDEKEEVPA